MQTNWTSYGPVKGEISGKAVEQGIFPSEGSNDYFDNATPTIEHFEST